MRLQIIPFHVGGHAAAGGAFSILRFPDQDLPDVVYVEQLTSALYLDKRDDVDHYAAAMERLCVEADRPPRTPPELLRGGAASSSAMNGAQGLTAIAAVHVHVLVRRAPSAPRPGASG